MALTARHTASYHKGSGDSVRLRPRLVNRFLAAATGFSCFLNPLPSPILLGIPAAKPCKTFPLSVRSFRLAGKVVVCLSTFTFAVGWILGGAALQRPPAGPLLACWGGALRSNADNIAGFSR